MRDVTDAAEGALPHRGRRRAADDLERHRRPRVGDRELLLARRRGARAARGVLRRAVQDARRDVRAHGAHGRLRVGRARPARRGRGGARRAPGQGRAAHAVRDLDRRDPADRAAREGRERRRRDGGRRRRLVARRRAVRVRRLGHRRRGRRLAEGAVSASPGIAFVAISERAWEASRAGDEPALLLRLGDLQALRRPSRTPRTRGPPRSA